MTTTFSAPLEMLHQKRQNQRITAIGIKGARQHVRKQKAVLKALRASDDDALTQLIPDAEWKLQEHENKHAELTNRREDNKSWIAWLDLALRLTRGTDGDISQPES